MSDDYLIRNCAPTLAGIKTANLFTCPFDSHQELLGSIRQMNKRLKGKGYDKGDGTFGDLIITYNVTLPTSLNDRQRDLLEQMRSAGN